MTTRRAVCLYLESGASFLCELELSEEAKIVNGSTGWAHAYELPYGEVVDFRADKVEALEAVDEDFAKECRLKQAKADALDEG